ncbi:hypothetical protein SCHPADRAFT_300172 [Schizopora paradoxa]|uniref:F-box domain-containing protein n=1 Tax=Schizopora paradoxa TaxID=27342 RepID=A0A0H2RSR1_9AGAM|nr:hypothetical protein SCHPADRAFT_300172 [Schizopora paradoxa]
MQCLCYEPADFCNFFNEMAERAGNIQSVELAVYNLHTLKLPKTLQDLSIRVHQTLQNFDVHNFVENLQSILQPIKRLHMDFSEYKVPVYRSQEGRRDVKRLAIKNVRCVDISIMAHRSNSPLLQNMYFSSVESLSMWLVEDAEDNNDYMSEASYDSFDLRGSYVNDPDQVFRLPKLWFTSASKYPNLKVLTLRLDAQPTGTFNNNQYVPKEFFTKIARCCPNLEDLTFEGTMSTESLWLPPLRSLTLKGLKICDHWVEEYGRSLKKDGNMEMFERLVLIRCRKNSRFNQQISGDGKFEERLGSEQFGGSASMLSAEVIVRRLQA